MDIPEFARRYIKYTQNYKTCEMCLFFWLGENKHVPMYQSVHKSTYGKNVYEKNGIFSPFLFFWFFINPNSFQYQNTIYE